MITQAQYNVLRQPTRRLDIKIDLINESDVIVGSFEGLATSGNISLDGSSTYRRSGSFTMIFDKKYNLLPNPDSKIWFNKRIGIHIGLKNYLDETIWFNMGRFAIDEVDLDFNSAEKTITCQLKDYMTFLDGSLSGNLSHQVVIDENTPISQAIKSTLIGLGRVSVEDISISGVTLELPYKIEKPSGSTVYELVMEMLNLYKGYDFYCDTDGYYTIEKIKDKRNDSIVDIFDGTSQDLTLKSTPRIDFKNVKNSIYIWGRQLDNGLQVRWNYRNRWFRSDYSSLDDLIEKSIGDICHIGNEGNSYMWDGEGWDLLDFRVNPIFNVESIGEKVFSESDDKIFNVPQAKLRTEYELQQSSSMAETISFSVTPLYYLKPNQKIQINIDDVVQGDYLITNVSVPMDISSPMTISAKKLYY